MKISFPKTIRRWRWEWLALLISILFYGACGYGCAAAWFSSSDISAEESKERFESRIAETQKVMQDYGIAYERTQPWPGMRYSLRAEGLFGGGRIDISLENEYGGEQYIMEMTLTPGEIPDQSLPDAESVHMACEIFSVLTGGEEPSDYSGKKISWLLEDARCHFENFEPFPYSCFVYSESSGNIYLRVNQETPSRYTTTIKFIGYHSE